MFRLPPPKADHPQSVQPPVTETEDEEERGDDGVASINYIVLDLDPTSTSEASAVTQASKTGDSVPNSAGINDTAPRYRNYKHHISGGAPRARGYVTIDFDKTDALIKSANHRYMHAWKHITYIIIYASLISGISMMIRVFGRLDTTQVCQNWCLQSLVKNQKM